jgi:hypothetical protein
MTDTNISKNIDLSSWIILYRKKHIHFAGFNFSDLIKVQIFTACATLLGDIHAVAPV